MRFYTACNQERLQCVQSITGRSRVGETKRSLSPDHELQGDMRAHQSQAAKNYNVVVQMLYMNTS